MLKQNVCAGSLQNEALSQPTNTLCLYNENSQHPFQTCLYGISVNRSVDTQISPTLEPQEIKLLGYSHTSYCFIFEWIVTIKMTHHNVNPHDPIYKKSNWCHHLLKFPTERITSPRFPPRGYFLICGDQAWSVIPTFH